MNNDWYEGELRGQRGRFPANYVQVVLSEPPPPPPSPPASPTTAADTQVCIYIEELWKACTVYMELASEQLDRLKELSHGFRDRAPYYVIS